MQTKDPNLSKTRIDNSSTETVSDTTDTNNTVNTTDTNKINEFDAKESKFEDNPEHKGTETLKDNYIASEHVKPGDNPARQPDRRDHEGGTPFDDNINEDTTGTDKPQSDEITDYNRYATIDNAQTRVLNEDLK
ncbi:hypothetical protein [Psychrobacter sp.]|uniref:hypothetical protein n=1 Tax=Psychrobacter sp. TaxID=56811 RepID=UPI0025FF5D29|nr:hypothetical protein [Psychrobacter sp.]